jgi:hypothetical protein
MANEYDYDEDEVDFADEVESDYGYILKVAGPCKMHLFTYLV